MTAQAPTLRQQLALVRTQMRQRERQQAAEAARQAEQAARAEREWFARAVGPVQPLKPSRRVHHTPTPAAALPRQRQLDEQAVMQEAISDEFDADSLLDTDDSLSYRRPGVGPEVVRKLRRGHWSLQGQIDLHGLRSDEARTALGQFIRHAHKLGWRCVRVVHGKGLGSPGRTPVLKGKTQRWLVQKKEVLAFVQARAADGGAGALIVLLAPSA
jgi:DNA-nicking Smr family endonuclease